MKILASDFDNTIFFLEDELKTKNNVEAIRKFIINGNIFCLITGRTYMEIKEELNKLNLPYSYLICGDGALIFDNLDFCIESTKLDRETVKRVVEILKENDYTPYLEDGYNITTNPDDCIKVSAKYAKDKQDAERIVDIISKELDVYAYASRAHVNINNKKNDKKQALLRLSKLIKISPNKIYTIGDSINDYEMLEYFNGAVVANHNDILNKLNLPKYNSVADYIEELSKN